MAYQIFVSYRRSTGDFTAQSFYDRLRAAGYRVFYDIEAMRSGKFNEQLYNVIDECSDFLLILTEGALDRCCNTDDWVRLEIEHALKAKKNIVLVLARNFRFPDQLPESIKDVKTYHGVTADTEFFDEVIRKIARLLIATPDAPAAAPGEQRAAASHEPPRDEPGRAAPRGDASRPDGGAKPMPTGRSKRMFFIIGPLCILAALGGWLGPNLFKNNAQPTSAPKTDAPTPATPVPQPAPKTDAPTPAESVPQPAPKTDAPTPATPVPPPAPGTDVPGVNVPGEPETCTSAAPGTDVSRLKEQAEEGRPDAQYRLGCLYKKGEGGVPQSDSEAAHWFKLAADQDIQAAAKFKYELALMYETGRGVPQDDSQAAELLKEAARTYPQAQFKLGMYYYSGQGVYQSFKHARECFLKAARQNLPEAQHALAWLYEKGKGGAKDEARAREWYDKAAKQGYEPSRAALERLDAQAR